MVNYLHAAKNVISSLFSPQSTTLITAVSRQENSLPRTDETLAGATRDEDITLDGDNNAAPRAPNTVSPGNETARPSVNQIVVSPAFKLLVILVFALIIITGVAAVWLSVALDPAKNPGAQQAYGLMSSAFTASVGAFLGLIGGKAIA